MKIMGDLKCVHCTIKKKVDPSHLQYNVNSPLVHFRLVHGAESSEMPDHLEEIITAMGQLHAGEVQVLQQARR